MSVVEFIPAMRSIDSPSSYSFQRKHRHQQYISFALHYQNISEMSLLTPFVNASAGLPSDTGNTACHMFTVEQHCIMLHLLNTANNG